MYDPHIVRRLCWEISDEKNPARVEELVSLLQAVVKDDQEEIRIRMAFLIKKYATVVSETSAAD
jgi:hypothetical protein